MQFSYVVFRGGWCTHTWLLYVVVGLGCHQVSLCNNPLQELSNPGASGSIFYITDDDEFIIKTVQHKEAEFLQKLLPGYYMVIVSPIQ